MRLNKTIYIAFAGAIAMSILYSVPTHLTLFMALAPKTSKTSINPLALAQYQKYAGNDPVGEKTIAENSFSWRHETWTGDDKPYQQIRQTIDTAIAFGTSPMHLAEEYQKQAQDESQSPLAQFRWGYSLWKTITLTSTWDEKQKNGLGTFFRLANVASPNTYDYARLRYLVSYHSQELTELGEKLLQRNTQDLVVKAHLALDYTTPGPELYNLNDKNRAIQLSSELIRANPKCSNYYAILAEAYTANYFMNGHHRQDGLAMISALKKYLSLATPNEYFYQGAKNRLADMEQRLNIR